MFKGIDASAGFLGTLDFYERSLLVLNSTGQEQAGKPTLWFMQSHLVTPPAATEPFCESESMHTGCKDVWI